MNSKSLHVFLIALLCTPCYIGKSIADELVGGIFVSAYSPECSEGDIKERGEKLHAATKRFANANCETAAIVSADKTGIFTQSHQAKASETCDVMQAWVDTSHRKSDMVKAGKRKEADCHIVEIENDGVGNDDGICTKNEMYVQKLDAFGCVEDDEDNVGDNDGICALIENSDQQGKRKKGVWENCLETCDMPEDEPEFDCDSLDLMATSMEEIADSLESTNASLRASSASMESRTYQLQGVTEGQNSDDPCLLVSNVAIGGLSDYEGFYGQPTDERPGLAFREHQPGQMMNWQFGSKLAEIAYDGCMSLLDQTIFGQDFSAGCAVAIMANQAISLMATETEVLDDAITGARIDNMTLCMEQMASELAGIDEKLDLILDYLVMPQGQRPDFPQKP